MADLTQRMRAADWLAQQSRSACDHGQPRGGAGATGAATKRTRKYGNRRVTDANGETYDSFKELQHCQQLRLAMKATDAGGRVEKIERQRRFELVPKQDGERAVTYVADFVVTYADGRIEVHDVKSKITRLEPRYVIKRKLMLSVHGIRIVEV